MSKDRDLILDAYNAQRARAMLDKFFIPEMKKAVAREKAQDKSSNKVTTSLITTIHGASIEEHLTAKLAKRSVN